MEVEQEFQDTNTDKVYDNAEITTKSLEVNYQHSGTGSTMEVEVKTQDCPDHLYENVETSIPLAIVVENPEITSVSTEHNAQNRSIMEVQLNNQDIITDNNVRITLPLETEIKNREMGTELTHDKAQNTKEMQLNSHSLNTNTDVIVESALEMEIINQGVDTEPIETKAQTTPPMDTQLNNPDLSIAQTDANVETAPLMETQIDNQDLPNEENITSCPENDYQYRTLYTNKTLFPLFSTSWPRMFGSKENDQTYVRGCKWAPDGTCCLTVINNDGMHLAELPGDLLSGTVNPEQTTDVLTSAIHVKESGLVYDFCWYPFMDSQIPASCGWITTKQRSPVQLWDAFDGSLRASYRGFNAVDEMEPAISVTFSIDGTRIIAGYKKVLRTFDIERPGRDFAEHKITSPASCFAVSNNYLAMGSWNTSISLYSVSQYGTYKSVGKLHGHSGGVTHVKFTPDGIKIVSGARKDHRLLVWDIRYYRRPLNILSRAVDTNQRIYFDISPCGRYLVTGGTDGNVKLWDVDHVNWTDNLNTANIDGDNVTRTFPLHEDCCNSVSIHPYLPVLATGSGQYHLHDPMMYLDDDKSNENTILDDMIEIDRIKRDYQEDSDAIDIKYSSRVENKLVIWWTAEIFKPSDAS